MSLDHVNSNTVTFVGDQLRMLEANIMGAIEDASAGGDGLLMVRNLEVLRAKIEEAHVWANHCLIADQREREAFERQVADVRHL